MGPHAHADQRLARFVRHPPGDHAAFDHTDSHVFAYAMNAVFDRLISEDISRRPSVKDISCWRETGHFEISVVVDRRRMATSEPFADLVGEDACVRHRLTVGADDAACDYAFALQSPSGLIRRRRPGRRLLCERHSRQRRAKKDQHRGHHVFHCQYRCRANYLRAGSRVNITVVSAPLLTVTRRLTALAPGASFHSFWLTLTIGKSVNSYSPGANLSITNRPFPSAVAPLPPESNAG